MSFWNLLCEAALLDLICELFSPKRSPIESRRDNTSFSRGNAFHDTDYSGDYSSGKDSTSGDYSGGYSGDYFGGHSGSWNDCIDDDIINDAFFDDF